MLLKKVPILRDFSLKYRPIFHANSPKFWKIWKNGPMFKEYFVDKAVLEPRVSPAFTITYSSVHFIFHHHQYIYNQHKLEKTV